MKHYKVEIIVELVSYEKKEINLIACRRGKEKYI